MKAIKSLLFLSLMVLASPAYAATCSMPNPLAPIGPPTVTFTCPDPVAGPAGPAGAKGATGNTGATGAAGVNGLDGKDGKDGKDGLNGLNGQDFDMDKALAISAALATPLYLGDSEKFSISGGLGFSESETALGFGMMMRIDKTFSLYGGGAMSTEGGAWAGRVGVRAGW